MMMRSRPRMGFAPAEVAPAEVAPAEVAPEWKESIEAMKKLRAQGLDDKEIQKQVDVREDYHAKLMREAEEAKGAPAPEAPKAKPAPISTDPAPALQLDEMD